MRIISTLIAALAIASAAAQAQQLPVAEQPVQQQAAVTPNLGTGVWKGTWQSNTSAATGDLTIQLTSVNAGKITGKLSMTRPNNQSPRWSCIDTPIEFTGDKQGEQMTVAVDFRGGCNKNEFKFTLKDGKLQGGYTTQSGSHGTYVLDQTELVAVATK